MAAAFLLVLFAYHETELARTNLLHFVEHGSLAPSVGEHVYVLNGAHSLSGDAFGSGQNVLVVERENACFDFGAWAVGLEFASERFGRLARYSHFVLMNASVRGPFLPLFEARPWWQVFTDQLGGPHNVGLVGTSLNCWVSLAETHLQSMFLVTHYRGLQDVVLPSGVLDCKQDHTAAVFDGEIPLSRAFLDAGFSLKTQLLAFHRLLPAPGVVTPAAARNEGDQGARLFDICLRLLEHNDHSGDLQYPAEYGGADIHPLEVVFPKAGRGVSQAALDAYGRFAGPG